eukprot:361935-Chlamydomonas_euryale.AAC.22
MQANSTNTCGELGDSIKTCTSHTLYCIMHADMVLADQAQLLAISLLIEQTLASNHALTEDCTGRILQGDPRIVPVSNTRGTNCCFAHCPAAPAATGAAACQRVWTSAVVCPPPHVPPATASTTRSAQANCTARGGKLPAVDSPPEKPLKPLTASSEGCSQDRPAAGSTQGSEHRSWADTMAPTSGWTKVGVDLFAGTCGGVSLVAVGHPLDTVKVRWSSGRLLQQCAIPCPPAYHCTTGSTVATDHGQHSSCAAHAIGKVTWVSPKLRTGRRSSWQTIEKDTRAAVLHVQVRLQSQPAHAPIYSGLVDCIQKTIQWEGFSGLYRGVTSPLTGVDVLACCYLSVWRQCSVTVGTDMKGWPKQLAHSGP